MRPPSLYEIALAQCQRYASCISDIGDLPYHIAKPWLVHLNRDQLALIEQNSPHICNQSDELWESLIKQDFRDRQVPSADFRRTYIAYSKDKAAQLGQAWERLKLKQAEHDASRKATSVVALSEEELPISRSNGLVPSFRSPLMRSVAKKSQASIGPYVRKPMTKPVSIYPRASSPPLAATSVSSRTPYRPTSPATHPNSHPNSNTNSNANSNTHTATANTANPSIVHPSLLGLRPPPSLASLGADRPPFAINSTFPFTVSQNNVNRSSSPPLRAKRRKVASVFMPRR